MVTKSLSHITTESLRCWVTNHIRYWVPQSLKNKSLRYWAVETSSYWFTQSHSHSVTESLSHWVNMFSLIDSLLVTQLLRYSASGLCKWEKEKENPLYGRHQLSRPMRIVGQIQFWRGCVIYRSAPKSGVGPHENANSVHAKVGTQSTQNCWLRSLRNTSPF